MKRLTSGRMVTIFVLSIALLVISAFAKSVKAELNLPREVSIASYRIGMSSYVIVGGYAKIISDHTPLKSVTVKPFAGPTVYMSQVNDGNYDMGHDSSPGVYRAYRGEGEFKKRNSNLRALWYSHILRLAGLAVRADSGITKVSQLRGKRVTSNFGGNINIHREVALWLLSGGLTWKDVIPVPVAGLVGGAKAMRDGRVDAFFGATPTVPVVVATNAAVPLRYVGLERSFTEIFKDFPEAKDWLPGTTEITVPPHGFLKESVRGLALPMLIVSSTHFSEEAAYLSVKAVFENIKEVTSVHPIVKRWRSEGLIRVPPIPFHAGAIRAYKEKGVWTKELEQAQKELLRQ